MGVKLGNLVAIGLLTIALVFGIVALSQNTWYTDDIEIISLKYGLTELEACIKAPPLFDVCIKYTYADLADQLKNTTVSNSEDKKVMQVRAGGGLAMSFTIINIFVIIVVVFFLLVDMFGDFPQCAGAKQRMGRLNDFIWATPFIPAMIYGLAIIFWCALFPYNLFSFTDTFAASSGTQPKSKPSPGAALILVIIAVPLSLGAAIGGKFLNVFFAMAAQQQNQNQTPAQQTTPISTTATSPTATSASPTPP